MTHQMILTSEHEGTEEWYCPTCGRRLLIEWKPWRKVTLELGDENALHSGGKSGLRTGSVDVKNDDGGEGMNK